MKQTILSIIALVLCTSLFAQESKSSNSSEALFYKGAKVAQIGIGLGSSLGLPLNASFEYGITDKIGIGPYIGYAGKSYDLLGSKYKVTSIIIAAKGNYHFYQKEKIDIYGGATLGFNMAKAKWVGTSTLPISASYGGFTYGFHVGGRYYFNPKIAGFAELGYGLGYLNIGLAFKL